MSENMGNETSSASFKRGELIFKEGQPAKSFLIVSSGKVACFKKSDDRYVVINVSGPKELVGEDSVLGNMKSFNCNAVALQDTEALVISIEDVSQILDSQSSWIKSILENISEKVSNTAAMIAKHRLEDDLLSGGSPLSDDELVLIRQSLN